MKVIMVLTRTSGLEYERVSALAWHDGTRPIDLRTIRSSGIRPPAEVVLLSVLINEPDARPDVDYQLSRRDARRGNRDSGRRRSARPFRLLRRTWGHRRRTATTADEGENACQPPHTNNQSQFTGHSDRPSQSSGVSKLTVGPI